MIIVNLEKYAEENYYKQPANSPGAASPDNITHARLYYDTFAGANYIQGDFVSSSNSTVEFDNTDVTYTLFKLFTSTDGVTYTERKSFGGTSGKDCVTTAQVLDAADFEDNQIIVKKTIDGIEQLIPYDLGDLITDEGIEVDSAGVEYKFVRGTLCQDNSVFSGKAFFGQILMSEETGLLIGNGLTYYQNGAQGTAISIADFIKRADSAKVSTGLYYLQCQLGTPGSGTNGFVDGLEGTIYNNKFEQSVIPIFGERVINENPVVDTYTIWRIYRPDATHVNIGLNSVTDLRTLTFTNNQLEITDLVCDIDPVPDGIYDITEITQFYITILCSSTSGPASFTDVSVGNVINDLGYSTYVETFNPVLKGYLVVDTMTDPLTYYGTGKVLLRTYDTDWVLADNILSLGYMVTIKANNI